MVWRRLKKAIGVVILICGVLLGLLTTIICLCSFPVAQICGCCFLICFLTCGLFGGFKKTWNYYLEGSMIYVDDPEKSKEEARREDRLLKRWLKKIGLIRVYRPLRRNGIIRYEDLFELPIRMNDADLKKIILKNEMRNVFLQNLAVIARNVGLVPEEFDVTKPSFWEGGVREIREQEEFHHYPFSKSLRKKLEKPEKKKKKETPKMGEVYSAKKIKQDFDRKFDRSLSALRIRYDTRGNILILNGEIEITEKIGPNIARGIFRPRMNKVPSVESSDGPFKKKSQSKKYEDEDEEIEEEGESDSDKKSSTRKKRKPKELVVQIEYSNVNEKELREKWNEVRRLFQFRTNNGFFVVHGMFFKSKTVKKKYNLCYVTELPGIPMKEFLSEPHDTFDGDSSSSSFFSDVDEPLERIQSEENETNENIDTIENTPESDVEEEEEEDDDSYGFKDETIFFIPFKTKIRFLLQIINTLEHIHKNGFIFRDLLLDRLSVRVMEDNGDKRCHPKVRISSVSRMISQIDQMKTMDFVKSIQAELNGLETPSSPTETPYRNVPHMLNIFDSYRAEEVRDGRESLTPIDIYSFGVFCYELLTEQECETCRESIDERIRFVDELLRIEKKYSGEKNKEENKKGGFWNKLRSFSDSSPCLERKGGKLKVVDGHIVEEYEQEFEDGVEYEYCYGEDEGEEVIEVRDETGEGEGEFPFREEFVLEENVGEGEDRVSVFEEEDENGIVSRMVDSPSPRSQINRMSNFEEKKDARFIQDAQLPEFATIPKFFGKICNKQDQNGIIINDFIVVLNTMMENIKKKKIYHITELNTYLFAIANIERVRRREVDLSNNGGSVDLINKLNRRQVEINKSFQKELESLSLDERWNRNAEDSSPGTSGEFIGEIHGEVIERTGSSVHEEVVERVGSDKWSLGAVSRISTPSCESVGIEIESGVTEPLESPKRVPSSLLENESEGEGMEGDEVKYQTNVIRIDTHAKNNNKR